MHHCYVRDGVVCVVRVWWRAAAETTETVRLLIAAGADVDLVTTYDIGAHRFTMLVSPLSHAAWFGEHEQVKLLLDARATCNFPAASPHNYALYLAQHGAKTTTLSDARYAIATHLLRTAEQAERADQSLTSGPPSGTVAPPPFAQVASARSRCREHATPVAKRQTARPHATREQRARELDARAAANAARRAALAERGRNEAINRLSRLAAAAAIASVLRDAAAVDPMRVRERKRAEQISTVIASNAVRAAERARLRACELARRERLVEAEAAEAEAAESARVKAKANSIRALVASNAAYAAEKEKVRARELRRRTAVAALQSARPSRPPAETATTLKEAGKAKANPVASRRLEPARSPPAAMAPAPAASPRRLGRAAFFFSGRGPDAVHDEQRQLHLDQVARLRRIASASPQDLRSIDWNGMMPMGSPQHASSPAQQAATPRLAVSYPQPAPAQDVDGTTVLATSQVPLDRSPPRTPSTPNADRIGSSGHCSATLAAANESEADAKTPQIDGSECIRRQLSAGPSAFGANTAIESDALRMTTTSSNTANSSALSPRALAFVPINAPAGSQATSSPASRPLTLPDSETLLLAPMPMVRFSMATSPHLFTSSIDAHSTSTLDNLSPASSKTESTSRTRSAYGHGGEGGRAGGRGGRGGRGQCGRKQWQDEAVAAGRPDPPHAPPSVSSLCQSPESGGLWIRVNPAEMECPLTHELMLDPVCTADGFTYERTAIEEWLAQHGISPVTAVPFSDRTLRPNLFARSLTRQLLIAEERRVARVQPRREPESAQAASPPSPLVLSSFSRDLLEEDLRRTLAF